MTAEGFDRLRRRGPAVTPGSPGVWSASDGLRDPQGRRTLFTVAEQPPCLGAVTVHCSGCRVTSVLSPRKIVTLALPSLHLPLIKRGFPSWMRCPACRRRTWVRLGIRL